MKKVLNFFLILFLSSCKGEPFKKGNTDSIKNNTEIGVTTKDRKLSNKLSENCYDYLTELVRSTNFPLSEWKIDKNKVNLLIDKENDDIILMLINLLR